MKPSESQALKWKHLLYPERYGGKVPLKIKMKCDVRSDIPVWLLPASQRQVALENHVYECAVNSYGAVSVIFPNGECLGVKPDEFEVEEYHP